MTILQTNLEISLLTNKITFAPSSSAYTPAHNPAPLIRTLISSLLGRIESISSPADNESIDSTDTAASRIRKPDGSDLKSLYPHLPESMRQSLLGEVIHAITAIGGHENPPARHIVGFEAVGSVKEKLKTVSEELEDFVEVSNGVDIDSGIDEDDADGSSGSGER